MKYKLQMAAAITLVVVGVVLLIIWIVSVISHGTTIIIHSH